MNPPARFLRCLAVALGALILACGAVYAQPYVPSPYIFLNQPNTWGQPQTFNGGITTGSINGNPATALAPTAVFVETYDPPNTVPGTTDETAAFTAAIAQAAATNGWVQLRNRNYYTASSFTVPVNVVVKGPNPLAILTYTIDTTVLPVILAAQGIVVSGGLENVSITNPAVNLRPANAQAMLANLANYTGTAVTLTAGKSYLNNLNIIGYAQAINTGSTSDFRITNVVFDCLAGITLNNMQDFSFIDNVIGKLELLVQGAGPFDFATIATVTNNGSGLIRVTTTAPNDYITGNPIVIGYSSTGNNNESISGRWNITVINNTTFDLTTNLVTGAASAYAPAVSATTTAGSNVIAVSSTNNLSIGQTFTGTNITGTQTITGVNAVLNEISIASGSNVTGSGATTLSVTNVAYTANTAQALLNSAEKPGACLNVTNSAALSVGKLSCINYDVAVNLNGATVWTKIDSLSVDGENSPPDQGKTGIIFNNSSLNIIHITYITGWSVVQQISAPRGLNRIIGGDLNTGYSNTGVTSIDLRAGTLDLSDVFIVTQAGLINPLIYVASGATLYLNNSQTQFNLFALGSSLANVYMANSVFGDFSGNTLRGPTASLAVPNAAGTAYQQALIASVNGIQYTTATVGLSRPTCNSANQGLTSAVTDATSPSYNGALTGGGTVYTPVLCNGTSWVSH